MTNATAIKVNEALKTTGFHGLTKNDTMTICLQTLIQNGTPANIALDTVCGEGSFDRLASDLYESLNAVA